jgi:predicted nuclease with RNAse H fold
VKTLGVDLAAATRKTAAAVIGWKAGGAKLIHLSLDVTDEEIVDLFGTSDITGIDCPLGWPDAFLPFIAGHLKFEAHPVLDHEGIAGRRLLAYRDTDRFVTGETGLIPLSVSADRLAHPAMRCAVIQAKIARNYGPQARDGSGRLAEVYPAASLKLWGIHARGYKGRGRPEAERLGLILDSLTTAAPWLDLAGYREDLASSDDMFDAVVASLTARAVSLRRTLRPAEDHAAAALSEGWIHLPSGKLADLTGAPPPDIDSAAP